MNELVEDVPIGTRQRMVFTHDGASADFIELSTTGRVDV